MKNSKIKVGVLGLGTVGSGVVKILSENKDGVEEKLEQPIELAKVLVKNLDKQREVELPAGVLTADPTELLENPEIDIIVEVIGGLEPTKDFVVRALKADKHVVTANKELMAKHGAELLDLATDRGVDLYFEASVAGGIPIIRSLKESLTANRIEKIMGIVNGTTNYILTKMTQEGADFDEVLAEAQASGYAEADPTADIDGYDAAYKLAILAAIAFSSRIDINEIYLEGISQVPPEDISYAQELGYVIKLLAIAKEVNGEIEARVHPTMIPKEHPLAAVSDVFNAVFVEGHAVGELMYYGRGAGSMPTASAVVADIIDVARNIIYDANTRIHCGCQEAKALMPMAEVESKYYLRLKVIDKPGVLSAVAKILAENEVSIASVIQQGEDGDAVPLVLITHQVTEGDIQAALKEIDNLAEVKEISSLIRVEDQVE
ncbi:homoserine dehydrogenase [Fuchsiella alkaliacetigena]|uniref:homoserine dehydrogenase n=1 Tax=Fuchsiella alkaliacetigena TaxID=957042 RepID=UPI00200A7FF6|nr:homoserine dehydrogenase [Fuchsiella alkaliacetigena]MCK8823920.1 homoserine dehydrogenase [Fuchsiella alkaliacetigena]